MHRSGTSAVTRLVNLLGLHTAAGDDLVPASEKNPTGYWESMSLVAFNERVLRAVGSDLACPIWLDSGWEDDARLDALRREAPEVFRQAIPATPWVWKDPRNCLTLAFWRSVLDARPIGVVVTRNPLEIVASSSRTGNDGNKIAALAVWERYVRQALGQLDGLPVLVTRYEDVLSDPVAFVSRARTFLAGLEVETRRPDEAAVVGFVDGSLRHAEYSAADVLRDLEVSDAQRRLFTTLEELEEVHESFSAPALPPETPSTEALLSERRRAVQYKRELARLLELERRARAWARVRSSSYAAPARRVYVRVRRLVNRSP